MKILKRFCCVCMVLFLLFTPRILVENAQREFVDARFVRKAERYTETIVLYHIARSRPYIGSLTSWLQKQADAFEKKHTGAYIAVEGMDEAAFYERLEYGRRADAYSFFSGSLYDDLLQPFDGFELPLREGLFRTDRCVPYGYSGYCKLIRNPAHAEETPFCDNDVLAARLGVRENGAKEEKAEVLITDLRHAGDLIRYRDGFALSELQPVDAFTDAVCWLGIDRDTNDEKTEIIRAFFDWLLNAENQQTLNRLGMLSVRADVGNEAPETLLKGIFKTYETVKTVDPFRWYAEYDTLREDAALARTGDADAAQRFTKRLQELIG